MNHYVPVPEPLEWIEALKRSWNIKRDCFRCELSALPLDIDNSHSPLALSCDHDPPREGKFLIVARVINDMKNDHEKSEFYRNVSNLARIIIDGEPNPEIADKYVEDFRNLKHWRR